MSLFLPKRISRLILYSSSTGTNSKTRADRGFALGWKPVQPSVIATLPEDVDAVLANKL